MASNLWVFIFVTFRPSLHLRWTDASRWLACLCSSSGKGCFVATIQRYYPSPTPPGLSSQVRREPSVARPLLVCPTTETSCLILDILKERSLRIDLSQTRQDSIPVERTREGQNPLIFHVWINQRSNSRAVSFTLTIHWGGRLLRWSILPL